MEREKVIHIMTLTNDVKVIYLQSKTCGAKLYQESHRSRKSGGFRLRSIQINKQTYERTKSISRSV